MRFILGGERAAAPEPAEVPAPASRAAPAPQASSPRPPPAQTRPAASKTPAANATPLTLQKVRAAWNNIRANVESQRQSLRAPLSRAAIESLESNAIVLSLPNAWSADALREHSVLVERAVAEVLGTPLKITVRVDATAGRAQAETEDPDALFDYAKQRIR